MAFLCFPQRHKWQKILWYMSYKSILKFWISWKLIRKIKRLIKYFNDSKYERNTNVLLRISKTDKIMALIEIQNECMSNVLFNLLTYSGTNKILKSAQRKMQRITVTSENTEYWNKFTIRCAKFLFIGMENQFPDLFLMRWEYQNTRPPYLPPDKSVCGSRSNC